VTVTDRCIPLVTAAYGTRVARPARTTLLAAGGEGSQLNRRFRPVLGDHRFVGKSRRAHGSRWGDWNSTAPVSPARGQKAIGRATCGFDERPVTTPARCYPRFAFRLRTQHGPRRVPVLSGRGRLWRLGPPRPGIGSAGRTRQGRPSREHHSAQCL
jgi:hypothetical protein